MNAKDAGEMTRAFLEENMVRVGLQHMNVSEHLLAAFIARHRIDPSEAEVITKQDLDEKGNLIVRTHVRRRIYGNKERAMS